VIETKTEDKHGYTAIQVGSGWIHPKNVSKSVIGHLKKVLILWIIIFFFLIYLLSF